MYNACGSYWDLNHIKLNTNIEFLNERVNSKGSYNLYELQLNLRELNEKQYIWIKSFSVVYVVFNIVAIWEQC